jgi:hypothetical protein
VMLGRSHRKRAAWNGVDPGRTARRRMVRRSGRFFLECSGGVERRRMMGSCSGFAGSAGRLRGAVRPAPLTAPRPAPRFTVHKNFSLQEQIRAFGRGTGGAIREPTGGAAGATFANLRVTS